MDFVGFFVAMEIPLYVYDRRMDGRNDTCLSLSLRPKSSAMLQEYIGICVVIFQENDIPGAFFNKAYL